MGTDCAFELDMATEKLRTKSNHGFINLASNLYMHDPCERSTRNDGY